MSIYEYQIDILPASIDKYKKQLITILQLSLNQIRNVDTVLMDKYNLQKTMRTYSAEQAAKMEDTILHTKYTGNKYDS